jgi:two-component system cell cycle sensor histidine kinase/response regulator CckA
MNVAVNARDAMTSGGTLSIETMNVDVDVDVEVPVSPYVRLRIRDTGRGMSAETLDRVFEPFFTTKAEGMGTGLGLATVYGIVTQAGGSITVRSRIGTGTTLTILLPATVDTADAADIVVPIEVAPVVLNRGHGETVLVVEDEDALRAVTERILTGHGYRVLVAADGVEALALAAGHDGEISLIVADVVMPNMAGDVVADRIRADRPGTKVLFMSGYAQDELASRSLLEDDVHLIEKPFSAEALLQQADQILDRHRAERGEA